MNNRWLLIFIFIVLFVIFVIVYKTCRNNTTTYYGGIYDKYNQPDVSKASNDKNIDVVYTWVDGMDQQWQSSFNKYKKADNSIPEDSIAEIRFTNSYNSSAELELSIALLFQNLSWVNTIYIVTMRPQIPSFLLPQGKFYEMVINGKIKIVHHDEIFEDKSNLPVFNSHAIEGNIHRIKGLQNKFIYFNDDMFITKPLKSTDFFIGEYPIARYTNSKERKNWKTCMHNASWRNFRLINNLKTIQKIIHFPTPLTKEIMQRAEQEYKDHWERPG